MKKAIYKIENLINHKIYIGESSDPPRRFKEHCNNNCKYISLIHKAIVKYGKENFSFEVIGWFENWKEQEEYYIQYYKSRVPYGYNIAKGGGEPPILQGENNPNHSITQQKADEIIKQFLDWKIPRKTIIANNHITQDIARRIIEGSAWRKANLQYPLRPPEAQLNKYRALYIQWLCCTSDEPLNQLGKKVGWNKSSAKMINQGNNHFNEKLKYPIRNNKEYNKKILSQETCIDYLHFEE